MRIFQFLRISLVSGLRTEDCGGGEKNRQTLHFCCRKAKNSCLAQKTLIYEIFVLSVEDKILRKFANEDKPQVMQPWERK